MNQNYYQKNRNLIIQNSSSFQQDCARLYCILLLISHCLNEMSDN